MNVRKLKFLVPLASFTHICWRSNGNGLHSRLEPGLWSNWNLGCAAVQSRLCNPRHAIQAMQFRLSNIGDDGNLSYAVWDMQPRLFSLGDAALQSRLCNLRCAIQAIDLGAAT